jgi:hypothetical protein
VSVITLICFTAGIAGCYSSRAVSMQELQERKVHTITMVVTKDGHVYEFKRSGRYCGQMIGDVVTCRTPTPGCAEIPIEEIDTVYITYFNAAKTTLGTIGVAAAVFTGLFLIALAMKESCPFIYSFDGEQYVFDGEPYGGAICPALQRLDVCQLEHLRPHEGQYLLRLMNEVNETQYTDELRLWVVDHPQGTRAIPDCECRLHTVEEPQRLLEAHEGSGRDVSLWLSDKDPRVWQSDIRHKDPEVTADLRDTLLLTFPKPDGAARAKLVVNGCNSLWSSHMLRRFLELQGSRAEKMLRKLEDPKTLADVTEFFYREEFFFLKVKVWAGGEWVNRGRIMGGGPFISEDRVILLDVADVEGDELRIRLAPPAGLWRFDWFAVDYSDDAPFRLQEVSATSALSDAGEDVTSLLSAQDGAYHVMPEVGQGAVLAFPAALGADDSERTVFAKVSGYYDIHLNSSGPARSDILARVLREPGEVVAYSLREYHDWQARLHAGREQ